MKLVYFSPVPWNSVAQRPHFFVKNALEHGFTSVLWVEPTPSRFPRVKDFRTKLFSVEANSFNKPKQVKVIRPRCIPIEPLGVSFDIVNYFSFSRIIKSIENDFSGNDTILVIGKPSRLANMVLGRVEFNNTIFDMMDDFPHFFEGISAKSVRNIQATVLGKANICLFSSSNLYEQYSKYAAESRLLLNACEQSFYEKCRSLAEKKHQNNQRVFGYIGSVAEWFDWSKVIKLAEDNPKDKVIIVGPNYATRMPVLPLNIQILPAIEHDDIPYLLASFDYGLIPFKVCKLTKSVDPVKYYEYIAAGIKVISTEFGEMKNRVERKNVYSFENFSSGIKCVPEPLKTWSMRYSQLFRELTGES